jgi:hypothetical protein
MNARLRIAFSAVVLAGAAGSSACNGHPMCSQSLAAADPGTKNAGTAASNAGAAAPASADRAIAEADIIRLDGTRLYAMSKSGTVSIVDVSTPGSLKMLGQTTLPGVPFEMYFRDGLVLAMANNAIGADGKPIPSTPAGATQPATGVPTQPAQTGTSSALLAIDVHDVANPKTIATFTVAGEIADSRMIGSELYLATYENAQCYSCGPKPRTIVTSFDTSDPTSIHSVDQMSFESNAPDQMNLAWGMAWKRSIMAVGDRLYVGGHADVQPDAYGTSSGPDEGIIDVLDVSDPHGHLARGAHIVVPGAVLSRWQMDETGGVLRVISQRGAGFTGNGTAAPMVTTFKIDSTQSFTALGKTALTLPRQEGLRTVHFDGPRAYAITFNQTDPLFTIDLSNPALPAQKGALEMPGWMFHLEPHGDRVIGLGVDRTDPNGSLNVSLFDVSDLATPKMIKRVSFGATQLYEDYQITNYELPEDQDRIQKAFRVFDDGLVAVPFSGTSTYGGADACSAQKGGIQLVDWKNDTLTLRTMLPVPGNPRRAIENGAELLTVSDSNVRSFTLASGAQSADLVIGACVAKTIPGYGDGQMGGMPGDGQMGGYDYAYGGSGYGQCE